MVQVSDELQAVHVAERQLGAVSAIPLCCDAVQVDPAVVVLVDAVVAGPVPEPRLGRALADAVDDEFVVRTDCAAVASVKVQRRAVE